MSHYKIDKMNVYELLGAEKIISLSTQFYNRQDKVLKQNDFHLIIFLPKKKGLCRVGEKRWFVYSFGSVFRGLFIEKKKKDSYEYFGKYFEDRPKDSGEHFFLPQLF